MKKCYPTLFVSLALFLLFSSITNAADNGFDQICQIYTQVLTNPSNKSLTKDKKMGLIYKKIHKTVTSKSALNAYETFMDANPQTRYGLLKQIAEDELKRSWECPIINTFNY